MATRSKYTRVKPQKQQEDKLQTDIYMKFSPSYGRYIARALGLFFGQDKSFVTIKSADRLMDKALWVSQIIKRKVSGLHQITQIKQKQIIDVYEPKQQGLNRVEQKRFMTIIQITLTLTPTQEQKKSVGYQSPIKVDQQQVLNKQKWQTQQSERKQKKEKQPKQKRETREPRQVRGQKKTRGAARK